MSCRRAFTLIELLMVVIIVGILAAMAIPQFGKTTERSYQQQASNMLQMIYAGERAFFSTNNRFCNPTTSGTGGVGGTNCNNAVSSGTATWNGIYMDDPTATTTTYAVTSTDVFATHFNATATRNGGTVSCNGLTMTIDETRTITGNWLNNGTNNCT